MSLPFFPYASSPSQKITYSTGDWDASTFGNHRAVLKVEKISDAVLVRLPWRRRDSSPENKNIIFIDAKTGERIQNVFLVSINCEFGDIVFQPRTTPGLIYAYYMPYTLSGRKNYPTVTYPPFKNTADPLWLRKNNLSQTAVLHKKIKNLPRARVLSFQSIDDFNSFYPMEIIATSEETKHVEREFGKNGYIVFPEDRKYPIRMSKNLPLRWVVIGPLPSFSGHTLRGEFYAFQLGIYALEDIEDIKIECSDLWTESGISSLPSALFSCFNTEGIGWNGCPFTKKCFIPAGKIQALWCGIQVPQKTKPGIYSGDIIVKPTGKKSTKISLQLTVLEKIIHDAGDNEPWRHSRLRWLNSRIAMDDDPVSPFSDLKIQGPVVECLGRRVTLGPNGFPERIQSFFNPENTGLWEKSKEVLHGPIRLVVETSVKPVAWENDGITILPKGRGAAVWETVSRSSPLEMKIHGRMEYDGFVSFQVELYTSSPLSVEDIRLEIPFAPESSKYMMGLGFKGGTRPAEFTWKWDVSKNQDALWIGDVNGGLQCSLRAENYVRPLNTNFYRSQPLNMPPSWDNQGKGGCRVLEQPGKVLFQAFSRDGILKPGKSLFFHFCLLITPFKPIDAPSHWKNRYYHAYEPITEILKSGANVINNHHANDVNPYINYPFIHTRQMKAYLDEAHRHGLKVKIYYTIRELSNRAAELFALRSLGHEIFSSGPGGGWTWLQEHLNGDYIAAWFVPRLKDAAIINSGMSRWLNYYLEGLNWLVRNIGIDGLYIDDVAYDRTTMKRVRKILDRGCPEALIDLHSANQYNERDGFASNANLYMEHFPYLNRLWFGEYFDYDASPDYWLVEMSGIPFGLMGEMLQDGGNPWRGMLFGMTARLPWSGNPRPIWKIWDTFGIQNAEMIGFWSERCPVKTDTIDVLATTYVQKNKILIALASWANKQTNVRLTIDWQKLGFNPAKVRLEASYIENFQPERVFDIDQAIPIEPGKGWLFILKH
ncbi:MAG: hypothetical protein JXB26_05290 [Candidatus Aminicenantes bacterium]|nr:hypothetical protein [Candidatus Aminicenantes bacterium]